jgi:DHA3 family tetracycline resistance protein-like MFS transporter
MGLQFFNAAFFSMIFVVTSLYEATVAGLSAWQLVLVGTTVEATIVLFEIPTGVVADAYSRRLSIIVGFAIMGIAFVVEGSYPYFVPILIAQVLWGIGYTFTSGSTQAWLSDEIGQERANRGFLHGNQFDLAGSLVGILAAIPLGNIAVGVPILVGGASVVTMAGVLAWCMPENGFRPTPPSDRNTFQHMAAIFRAGLAEIRQRPPLTAILGVGLIYGLYSEGWDRLWVKYLVDHFTLPSIFGFNEVAFFGLLRAGGMVLSIMATRLVEKCTDANHAPSIARAMLWLTAVRSGAILAFAFSPALALSVGAVWVVNVTRSLIGPLYDAWINQGLDSRTRATVISMSGQVDAIGQITSGPIAAAISLWSIRAAITGSGLLLLPALPLIVRANQLHSRDLDKDATAARPAD